jgi:AmpE protein
MKLLALILAYLFSHLIKKPQRFRQFNWFEAWSKWFRSHLNWSVSELTVIVVIALPVIVIAGILMSLFDSTLGGLLVSILVLSYCIGPESLDEEVASDNIRAKIGLRKNAKVPLLIKTMTQVSMKRWFGVFFWYVVLGIVGALIYRLTERLDFFTGKDDSLKASISKAMKILNYPVAWMMTFSLAIASDFERIFKKCKVYMTMENLRSMDDSFLYDATDFAVENCEVEPGNETKIEQITINVLKRMLLVWLVIVSILVILAV